MRIAVVTGPGQRADSRFHEDNPVDGGETRPWQHFSMPLDSVLRLRKNGLTYLNVMLDIGHRCILPRTQQKSPSLAPRHPDLSNTVAGGTDARGRPPGSGRSTSYYKAILASTR
jgi:hypothetical protein